MKEITSAQNSIIKHLVKLRKERDYRQEQGSVLIEGKNLIAEVCRSLPAKRIVTIHSKLIPQGIQTEETLLVPQAVFDKASGVKNPEGILAEVAMPQGHSLDGMRKVLAFDGVSDPGNTGTLLRTALALGWEGVFILPNSCDPYNDKALRSAKGATFRIPIRRGDWEELRMLIADNDWTPIAADIEGENLKNFSKPESILLVMGNESQGISPEAAHFCRKVTIPMPGEMESLNVSVAGGILMYALS